MIRTNANCSLYRVFTDAQQEFYRCQLMQLDITLNTVRIGGVALQKPGFCDGVSGSRVGLSQKPGFFPP
jgi:hypothetical protein